MFLLDNSVLDSIRCWSASENRVYCSTVIIVDMIFPRLMSWTKILRAIMKRQSQKSAQFALMSNEVLSACSSMLLS